MLHELLKERNIPPLLPRAQALELLQREEYGVLPAPPDAMTGTFTALLTASSISRSKPCLTPSVSMELSTTSPAPLSTQRLIQEIASMPVSSLPPLA